MRDRSAIKPPIASLLMGILTEVTKIFARVSAKQKLKNAFSSAPYRTASNRRQDHTHRNKTSYFGPTMGKAMTNIRSVNDAAAALGVAVSR